MWRYLCCFNKKVKSPIKSSSVNIDCKFCSKSKSVIFKACGHHICIKCIHESCHVDNNFCIICDSKPM